jgi:hypothetical protein
MGGRVGVRGSGRLDLAGRTATTRGVESVYICDLLLQKWVSCSRSTGLCLVERWRWRRRDGRGVVHWVWFDSTARFRRLLASLVFIRVPTLSRIKLLAMNIKTLHIYLHSDRLVESCGNSIKYRHIFNF